MPASTFAAPANLKGTRLVAAGPCRFRERRSLIAWTCRPRAFQKKSKSGIKTPIEDMELIQRRLEAAEADYRTRPERGKAS